jgi:hypothetical protein
MARAALIAWVALTLCAGLAWKVRARPEPRTLRYEEDHRYLRAYTGEPSVLDPLRDIVLDHAYLSLGASLRVRQDVSSQPFFGLRGVALEDFTTTRMLLHLDAHLTRHARAFVELGSMWAFGRSLPERSIDEDRFDVQQAFIDLHAGAVTLRAGRQSFSLGSARLVGIREGTNVRLAFDGVRLMSEGVQLLALSLPAVQRGVLDNRASLDELLFGAYGTIAVFEQMSIDLYYLGYRGSDVAFLDARGRELRHSLGIRLFGRAGIIDFNNEVVLQFGDEIVAWTAATDHGATAIDTSEFDLRIGVRANIASGDRTRGDGTLGTFSPLFPKLPYFSEHTLISPSNMIDLHPVVSARIYESVSLELGIDFFWRHSEQDAIYTSPNRVLIEPFAGRFTGTQLSAQLELRATRELTLTLYVSYFDVSRKLAAAGAHHSYYFGFWSVCLL